MTYEEYMMESVCSVLDKMVESGTLTEQQADNVFDLASTKYMSERRTLDRFGDIKLRGMGSNEEESKFANCKLVDQLKNKKDDNEDNDQSLVKKINKTEKYISEARRLDKEIIKKADKIKALQNEIQKNPDMTDEEKRNLLDKIDNKAILPAYKDYDYNGKPYRLTVGRFKQLQNEMKQNPKSSIKIIDDDKVDKIHRAKTNVITKDNKAHDLTPAKEKEAGKYLKELKKRNLAKAVDNL